MNPYISKFDSCFDAAKSAQYRMTIQFALGGFSYAVFDSSISRPVALEYYQANFADSNELFQQLERALAAKELNDKSFQSITCLIDERICTLVPEELCHPNEREKMLGFSFNLPKGYVVAADKLEEAKAMNLFAFPESLRNRIMAKWANTTIRHATSVFIDNIPKSERPTVYVCVRNRDFDMVVMRDKLLFFNNFKFNTKGDFVYFLLFAMEQFGLSGQDTPVVFTGLILPSSEIIDLCGRYVRDIRFVEKPDELKAGEVMAEVPYQYYYIHYQELRLQS